MPTADMLRKGKSAELQLAICLGTGLEASNPVERRAKECRKRKRLELGSSKSRTLRANRRCTSGSERDVWTVNQSTNQLPRNEEMDMCIACRAGSQDCMSDFLLTAYMGESSARCEKETRQGPSNESRKWTEWTDPEHPAAEPVRSAELAPASPLTRPASLGRRPALLPGRAGHKGRMDGEQGVTRMDGVQGDVDDEEENRTQVLDGEIGKTTLCVGAADRKLCDVFITLRKSSGEDVAEGKLEWDDLIEAFDKYEVTEDSEGNEVLEEQTIFVELVNEKVEGEFDEEWLVWVEARVTFKNELDSKCEEMPYSKRIFQLDPPGQIFYEGMERFLAWDPTSESLQELPNRLLAERVQVTNGGVSVMISFPARTPRAAVTAGFNEAGEQVNAHSTMEEDKGEALPGVSHRFIICRTWTLADFELMYASFCRMNSMEMERVTESALQEYGMVLAREQLKVVKGLRKPLLFEQVADEEVIDCPGLIMVADQNISARSALGPNIDITGGGSDAGGSRQT
ncbi:unnamed protein product [Durusdinium trenchii]|uniref:Uncharacterized protein n=1 Tax=Durusdinium trenchii TaxID=1381693 RepID=A0ABP0JNE3_9DINO